jgi:hypothetical protein
LDEIIKEFEELDNKAPTVEGVKTDGQSAERVPMPSSSSPSLMGLRMPFSSSFAETASTSPIEGTSTGNMSSVFTSRMKPSESTWILSEGAEGIQGLPPGFQREVTLAFL